MLNRTLAATCAACALCFVVACNTTPTDDGPCTKGELAKARAAIAGADAADRGRLMVQAMSEACPSLPIAKTMGALGTVDPADRATLVAGALSQDVGFGKRGCDGDFMAVFSSVAAVAPKDKANVIYDGCQYGKLGLMSKAEMSTAFAGGDGGASLLAHPTYAWLVDKGMKPDAAKSNVRAMLGL